MSSSLENYYVSPIDSPGSADAEFYQRGPQQQRQQYQQQHQQQYQPHQHQQQQEEPPHVKKLEHTVTSFASEKSHAGPVELSRAEKLQETWLWESLSIVWAVGCLAAIVIILANISEKAVSSWTLPIEPNALISVFSALAKAALMTAVPACISQLKWLHVASGSPKPLNDLQTFDEASRGPFGSLLFMWGVVLGRGKSMAAGLASLGCVITMVVLALEPFTQQIISHRERMVPVEGGTASMAVAYAYDTGASTRGGTWTPSVADDEMQGAILAGIYSAGIDPSGYETCSSSNCTFPAASSLSVCSACTDVTAKSKQSCDDNEFGVNVQDYSCNYTTPGNITLQATMGPAPSAARFYTMLNASVAVNSLSFSGAAGSSSVNGLIARVGVLRVGNGTDFVNVMPDLGRVEECEISWCMATYSPLSTFANGTREVHTKTEPLHYEGIRESRYGMLGNEARDTYYSVNLIDTVGAGRMLERLFTTSLGSEQTQVSQDDGGFSLARRLYNAQNMSELFDGLASSMTAQLRVKRNTTIIDGQAWRNETYIHVYWPWLTLPAIIAVSATVLLVVTAGVNAREKGELWRSNLLPFMFVGREWGVDDMSVSGTEGKGNASQMAKVAEVTAIRYRGFLKEGYANRPEQ